MDDGRKKTILVVGSGKVEKAVPAAGTATTQPPVRAVRKTPPPPDAAAGVAPPQRQQAADDDDEDEPVEAVDESAAAAGQEQDDDDDDEQVERFYALLASIRAMRRGLPPFPCSGGTGARTKRTARADEPPPWTPAFRMEDFEEPSPRASSKRQRQAGDGADDSGGGREGPIVVVVTPTPTPHAADRLDDRRAAASLKD